VFRRCNNFFWSLAHNSLPAKQNIARRGIECDTLCLCCRRLDEDGAHLLLNYKQVKKIWRMMELDDLRDHMCTLPNARSVVHTILATKTNKQILLCCTLWRWWTCRNKLNAEGNNFLAEEVVKQGRYWASECAQFCQHSRTNRPKPALVS
jgi:hypothetical protein